MKYIEICRVLNLLCGLVSKGAGVGVVARAFDSAMCICMHQSVYVMWYIYVYIYIYIYIHTYTYRYIHTHIYMHTCCMHVDVST